MNFASDNWAGASEKVMASLARHNSGLTPAYGSDPLTDAVTDRFCKIFEKDVSVFFVGTGSVANALALAAYARPGAVYFAHQDAHLQVDECGCPELHTGGGKIIPVPGAGGKIDPAALSAALDRVPDGVVHHGQAAGVSITQSTECGSVYSINQIREIAELARSRNLPLHMDGARFANALTHLDVSPADMTWKAGVDVLSFGATKNGCWCAEAVVFFDTAKAKNFGYLRKRAGHLFSKSRFIGAQFDGYFEDGNWLETARHANAMATRLAAGLAEKGIRTAWPVEANEVFPVLSGNQIETLRQNGAMFYEWPFGRPDINDGETVVRLVTSFATAEDDIDRFIDLVG